MKEDPCTYYMYDGERYDCNISYTSVSMQAPPWIFKIIQTLLDTDVQLRSISISTPSLYNPDTLNDLKIDSNSHQKTKSSKMNTAKKLSYEERFKNMGETDQYSISQAMFRDTKDAIDLYDFLEELKGKRPEDQQAVLRLAQADILAILLDRVELTKNYLGINSSPLDLKSADTGSGEKEPVKMGPEKQEPKQSETKKDPKVVQMKPDPDSPAGKQQKAEPKTEAKVETKSEEKKTETSATPEFKEISDNCKSLLKEENGSEKAFEYAKEFLGTGNYIPKKDKQKPVKWEDKKILSWVKDISIAIGQAEKAAKFVEEKVASTKDNSDIKPAEEKKEEKETKQEIIPLTKMRALKGYLGSIQKGELKRTPEKDDKLSDTEKGQYAVVGKFAPTYVGTGFGAGIPMFDRDRLVGYSIPATGLTEETKALNIFAERYLQLINKGSEDKEVADAILPIFFSNRGYDEKQIQKWVKAIKNAGDEFNKVDHLTVLGTPKLFFPEGLTQAELSYDDFVAILKDTEKSLEEKQTLCAEHLSGKTVKWDPFEMELYTDNHVFDYVIKKIIEVEENDKQNAIHTYDQKNMAILCQAAFENSVSEEDFIKEHIDLILKPDGTFRTLENEDNGYKVEIKNKGDFEKYVHDIYEKLSKEDTTLETQKENGSVSVEKKEESESTDRRITILKSGFEEKLKAFDDIRNLFDDSFIQDILENGVVIDAHSDPDHKDTTVEYFEPKSKKLKDYLKAMYAKLHAVEYTKPDTFDDGDVRVYSFSQLQEEGNKLVKAGKTKEEMVDWVTKNILNRRLEDQSDDKAMYQDANVIPNMVDALFGFAEKKETEPLMSEEAGKDAIDKMLKDEKMSLMQVIKAAKDVYNKMGEPKKLSEIHKEIMALAETVCPEKYKAHKERVAKVGEKKQTFVQEKFSQIHPEEWEKLKETTSLDDLFNACVSYKDKDDWRVGLALALEVMPLGKIESAKDWTVEQITEWYNSKVLSDPTAPVEEKKKEEPKKETEDVKVPEHLNEVMNASSPKSFKRALDEVVKNHEDTQEARKNMINAIKFGTGKHTRKISKMPEKDIHDMINAAKTRVEKHKK